MAQLTVGTTAPAAIVKVRPGQTREALEATRRAGADEVVFELKGDTYVAAGRGMALGDVAPGVAIAFDGEYGKVTRVQDRVNSTRDSAKAAANTGAVTLALATVLILPGAVVAPICVLLWLAVPAVVTAGTFVAAEYLGRNKGKDLGALKATGDVLPPPVRALA